MSAPSEEEINRVPAVGDRGFDSISLRRRVACEPLAARKRAAPRDADITTIVRESAITEGSGLVERTVIRGCYWGGAYRAVEVLMANDPCKTGSRLIHLRPEPVLAQEEWEVVRFPAIAEEDEVSLASILVQSPLDESTHLLVLRDRKRAAVALLRLVAAAESTEHVGASEVKRFVLLQGARSLDARQQLQTVGGGRRERDSDRAIQLDYGRALVAKQLLVEDDDLPPVRLRRRRRFGVHGRNCSLDLVRAWTPCGAPARRAQGPPR
jgi:hypothetical protein